MDRVPPTRMGLLHTRARRRTAVKGVGLLRSKREALAADFFKLVHGLLEGRERLETSLRQAAKALPVEIERRKIWGIPTPEVSGPRLLRAPDARGASPQGVSLGAAEAARTHEEALEILLNICSREIRLRRLGEEIRRTSRRINALEQFLIPRLDGETSRIELALEEHEREDLARLKRFKAKGDGGAS
jgi:V/A-type H+-transporting ATPase subunit D